MSDQPPAGYSVTIETEEATTTPNCVSCFEQHGWKIWEHTPIAYQDAEQEGIRCDWCHRPLVVDFLQRQIDAAGRLLRDWYSITQGGPVGVTDFGGHEDYVRLKQLQTQSEPYYYQYVEHGRKKR